MDDIPSDDAEQRSLQHDAYELRDQLERVLGSGYCDVWFDWSGNVARMTAAVQAAAVSVKIVVEDGRWGSQSRSHAGGVKSPRKRRDRKRSYR